MVWMYCCGVGVSRKARFYQEWFNDWKSVLEEYCIDDIKALQDLAGDQDA